MIRTRLLPDGTVVVPMRAEGSDGEVGDGVWIVKPGDPGYEEARREAENDDVR